MIKTNWYVITGTLSSGKTAVINYIAFSGYYIVPEVATIIIDDERSLGKTTEEIRSDEIEFQRRILQKKIDVENQISPSCLTFFDRGLPDSIAYFRLYGEDPSQAIEASKSRQYKGIFFFLSEGLPLEKDYRRTEDEETALKLDKLLYEAYSELDYEVIRVPKISPISERARFILSRIEE